MRKVLAGFLSVVLVFPLFMAALVTVAVSTWVLDRDLYTRVLGDARLYEIPAGSRTEGFLYWPWTPELGAVPPASASAALREVVTADYMKSQALALLDDSFDFVEGRSEILDPVIDLVPVKNALKGEGGKRFARALAASLPVCASQGSFAVRNGVIPSCRPSGVSVARAAEVILQALPQAVSRIPDSYRAHENAGLRIDRGRWKPAWGFSLKNSLILADVVLMLAACSAWLLASFIGGADARGRLYWLGGMLLIPAVPVFLIGLVVNTGVAADAALFGIESARLGAYGFSRGFVDGLFGAAGAMIGRISAGFLATGAVALGLSIALLFWGRSRPRAAAAERPAPPEAPPASGDTPVRPEG